MPTDSTTTEVSTGFISSLNQVGSLANNAWDITIGLLIVVFGIMVLFVIYPVSKSIGAWVSKKLDTEPKETDIKTELSKLETIIHSIKDHFSSNTTTLIDRQAGIKDHINELRTDINKVIDDMLEIKEQIASVAFDVDTIARQYTNILSYEDAVGYASIITESLKNDLVIILMTTTNSGMVELSIKTQVRERFMIYAKAIESIRFTNCPEGLPNIQDWVQHHIESVSSVMIDYSQTHKDEAISVSNVLTIVKALVGTIQSDISKLMQGYK